MINIELRPSEGRWTESRLQLYYMQQIAFQRETLTAEIKRQNWLSDELREARISKNIADCHYL